MCVFVCCVSTQKDKGTKESKSSSDHTKYPKLHPLWKEILIYRDQNTNQLVTCPNKFLQWRFWKAACSPTQTHNKKHLPWWNLPDSSTPNQQYKLPNLPSTITPQKWKARKLLCHFFWQPFSKNHIPIYAHPLVPMYSISIWRVYFKTHLQALERERTG